MIDTTGSVLRLHVHITWGMLQNFLDEEDNNFITALTAQDRDV